MGYTTEFAGDFEVQPRLSPDHLCFLMAFSETRHMLQDEKESVFSRRLRERVGLPYDDGLHSVNSGSSALHEKTDERVPGIWCQWRPKKDGSALEWDGGEKFYHYVSWLDYLLRTYLTPWGYTLSGTVWFRGEDWDDAGRITIVDGRPKVERMIFPGEECLMAQQLEHARTAVEELCKERRALWEKLSEAVRARSPA